MGAGDSRYDRLIVKPNILSKYFFAIAGIASNKSWGDRLGKTGGRAQLDLAFLGADLLMCWYPYPGYGQFLPYPHDGIGGGGVGIIFVEEAHMTTVRGHGVA